MKMILGGDHYTLELSEKIRKILQENYGIEVVYFGSKNPEHKVSLPSFIKPVCDAVKEQGVSWILLCGTGAGVNIWANKIRWIRAALCRKPIDAYWARQKDNANVLCLSSWDTSDSILWEILHNWIHTKFENHKIMESMEIMDNWRE